ncbi:kinase binding protein CGI-121-domain-containing protein [Scheffersomyces xylosifermentans]|uniref:kinase binding protein CGI-121-domain-containing protein n=1 Tax=Scheffersomyces xylosifermentans TaxID=1304137 RepID=UPI00315DBB93
MSYTTINFPQFPQYTVFVSLFQGVEKDTLNTVKQELIAGNEDYDFCFLNTAHLISLEQLYSSIHRAILNFESGNMRAKTLNTEIIFNLSPVNKIMEALKSFGVDEKTPNLVAVKVFKSEELDSNTIIQVNNNLVNLLKVEECQNLKITDELLYKLVDIAKFKKTYKLNDAKISDIDSQGQLTRLAIADSLLRGL